MARQEMFVDLLKLKQIIDQLEDEQIASGAPAHRPFRSRNELHKAVAATDWGQAIGLTPVVVALRIDRYSIDCKTGARAKAVAVSPTGVTTERKSVYRGIDLDAFLEPFMERGLEITSLSSIVTSSLHNKNTNLKIQASWHDLRERFNIPRVGDKPQETQSIMPLDQIRLPGDLPVDESAFEVVEDLPTDEELAAEEFPELYSQEGLSVETLEGDQDRLLAGLNPNPPDENYNEAQPVYDEFYDPATDEAGLEQVQNSMDAINQEESGVNIDQEPYLDELPLESDWGYQKTEEDPQGELQEEYLATGEVPPDEYQEVYPEREDPQAEDRVRELEEWLAMGEAPPVDHHEPYPEGGFSEEPFEESETLEEGALDTTSQDEYLPLDDESTPVIYDNDNYDETMFDTEETDPADTR